MTCSAPKGKSKMTLKQQGASQRPCFCMAFDRVSLLCRIVAVCIAVVSLKDNEDR